MTPPLFAHQIHKAFKNFKDKKLMHKLHIKFATVAEFATVHERIARATALEICVSLDMCSCDTLSTSSPRYNHLCNTDDDDNDDAADDIDAALVEKLGKRRRSGLRAKVKVGARGGSGSAGSS